MQLLISLYAVKKGCSKGEAAAYCSGSLFTTVLCGVSWQLERGFTDIEVGTSEPVKFLCRNYISAPFIMYKLVPLLRLVGIRITLHC